MRSHIVRRTAHNTPSARKAVDMLKKNIKGIIKQDDEEFMPKVCQAMDTNSFETAVVRGDSSTSLRALFPLGALTNHQCIPNTKYIVNEKGELLVYATVPIAKGDEITMSYVDLLWDTMMRRQFLLSTKHFLCQCARCSDATECGSLLSALHCANDKCLGQLLPNAPLNFKSIWTCNGCGLIIKSKQILAIIAGIIAATEEVLYENPRKTLRFVIKELSILVPETNYVMMEMIFKIISLLGRADDYAWADLTEEELNIKIKYCNKLIQCLDKLNCVNSIKKGLILYELYCTNLEKMTRVSCKEKITSADKINCSMNELILYEVMKILKDSIVAPSDYRAIYYKKI